MNILSKLTLLSLGKGLKAVKFVQLIENMQYKEQILKDNCNYVSELIFNFPLI